MILKRKVYSSKAEKDLKKIDNISNTTGIAATGLVATGSTLALNNSKVNDKLKDLATKSAEKKVVGPIVDRYKRKVDFNISNLQKASDSKIDEVFRLKQRVQKATTKAEKKKLMREVVKLTKDRAAIESSIPKIVENSKQVVNSIPKRLMANRSAMKNEVDRLASKRLKIGKAGVIGLGSVAAGVGAKKIAEKVMADKRNLG